MQKLDLQSGDYVRIESIAIPKAKRITIRLLSKELALEMNIKELFIIILFSFIFRLENHLRKFVVFAEGDRIPIFNKTEPEFIGKVNEV